MSGLTYDTGALIAAERADRRIWVLHRRALERRHAPTIPAAVLAEAWRGVPQARLSRLLAGCRIDELTEQRARASGAACAAAGTSDVVDASVVVGVASRGDRVVTSDPGDMQRLADALNASVDIVAL